MLKTTWPLLILVVISSCCRCNPQRLLAERAIKASQDQQYLDDNIDLPKRCLTLQDIIDISLENNLDLAVKAQEYAIQREVATRTALRMLPDLNVGIDWTYRNNQPAGSSLTLTDKFPPLPPGPYQVSTEKRTYFWNISLAWNLLDFGLSYFQAQAECDRLIVAEMEYERVKQNLILTAVQRYWRAIISKRAVDIAAPLLKELERQKKILESHLNDQLYFSLDQLYPKLNRIYQREIQLKGFNDRTDSSDPTQGYEKEYQNAMFDLANLMGIPPDTKFELCPVNEFPYALDYGDLRVLEEAALVNRPELYSSDAKENVGVEAVYAAILQELPGIRLFRTFNRDDNKFLLHHSWWQVGVQTLWNLLSIPGHYYESLIGQEQQVLAVRNRLVESMAVLTQVQLSNVLYEQNLEQYLLAKRLADSYEKMINVLVEERQIGKVGAADLLQNQIDAALARISQLKIYAELQFSVERMNNAIGLPRYFTLEDDNS